MWGAQAWNQWALQPSMFQNVPHEEIDWAALAKQWIQMQHVHQQIDTVCSAVPSVPPPPPPPPPPMGPEDFSEDSIPPTLLGSPMNEESFSSTDALDRSTASIPESGTYPPGVTDVSYWSNSEWEMSASADIDERIWAPQPVETVPSSQGGKETFDYGHVHGNQPLSSESVDYNHGSEQFAFNQVYTPENQYDQYWSQVGAAPSMIAPTFLKKDRLTGDSSHIEEDISHIDAAKRKQLPAWIREGLEKMEQERLKRLEKERSEKEKAERLKAKKLMDESSKKGLNLLRSGGYNKSSTSMPLKSKFESDSEIEDEEEEILQASLETSPIYPKEENATPVIDHRSEEEKQQALMLKVRRMLTEILLEVTNDEMFGVAREVHQKALAKGGLASYGSHSEASGTEDEDTSDSDEELYRRIREKRRHFADKEKKIIAELDKIEAEEREKKEQGKLKSETENIGEETEKVSPVIKPAFIMPSPEHDEKTNAEIEIKCTDVKQLIEEDPSGVTIATPLPSSPLHLSPLLQSSVLFEKTTDTIKNVIKEDVDTPEKELMEEETAENTPLKTSSDSESDSSSSELDSTEEESGEQSEGVKDKNKIGYKEEQGSKIKKLKIEREVKKKLKRCRQSASPEKEINKPRRSISKGTDRSKDSDSSSKYVKSHTTHKRQKHRSRSKKRGKGRNHKKHQSSSSSSSSSHRKKAAKQNRTESRHEHNARRRSWSYDRHRKFENLSHNRDRSRSRSGSFSRHRHSNSRSTSRSRYHRNSIRARHKDKSRLFGRTEKRKMKPDKHYLPRSESPSPVKYKRKKKDNRWSHSRSRSRTPRKYRTSRSTSSESGSSGKKSSIRHWNR